jgi:hypothetical protein
MASKTEYYLKVQAWQPSAIPSILQLSGIGAAKAALVKMQVEIIMDRAMDFMAVELRDGLTVGGDPAKKEFTPLHQKGLIKKFSFLL